MDDFNPLEFDNTRCQICGGEVKDLFVHSGYQIVKCTACGFGFVDPTPSEQVIVAFYDAFGGHGTRTGESLPEILAREQADPGSSLDAARVAQALVSRLGGGSVLDIGCGYGFFSRASLAAGFKVTALEIAKNERAIAERMVPEAAILATTFERFDSDARFDAIIMSQVLEHAREPRKWLVKARSLLREGAVIAIALPNFDGLTARLLGRRDPYVFPPAHLNYFSPTNLAALLGQTGFEVFRTETVSRFPRRTFERRLGRRPGQLAHRTVNLAVPLIDAAGKGTMINIFGTAV